MAVSFGLLARLFVFAGFCCYFCEAQVSKTSCTSGGTQCNTITHSACVDSKCKCNAGFNESANACTKVLGTSCTIASDCSTTVQNSNCSSTCACIALYTEKENLCVKSVSKTPCTSGGTECNQIENAECVSKKCKCKKGFKDTVNTCEKVLGGACTGNAECTTTVPQSECATSKTCACVSGYAESDALCAKPVSETLCTKSGNQCHAITNSACDVPNKKCKCNSGFKENVNKCAAESKATTLSTKATIVLFAATLLSFVFRNLF